MQCVISHVTSAHSVLFRCHTSQQQLFLLNSSTLVLLLQCTNSFLVPSRWGVWLSHLNQILQRQYSSCWKLHAFIPGISAGSKDFTLNFKNKTMRGETACGYKKLRSEKGICPKPQINHFRSLDCPLHIFESILNQTVHFQGNAINAEIQVPHLFLSDPVFQEHSPY